MENQDFDFDLKKFLIENTLTPQSAGQVEYEGKVKSTYPKVGTEYEIIDYGTDTWTDDWIYKGKVNGVHLFTSAKQMDDDTIELSDEDLQEYIKDGAIKPDVGPKGKDKYGRSPVGVREKKEPEEGEVTGKDVKTGDKATKLATLQKALRQVESKKNELVSKYKAGELPLEQYKQAIGDIPEKIKTLRGGIAKLERKLHLDENPESM